MSRRLSLSLLLPCLLALSAALPAQDDEKQRWVPHNEGLQEQLTGVSIPLKSTDVIRERFDWGVTKKPHPRYGDPIVEAEIEEEKERNRAWAERQRALQKELKLKGSTIETENFILHWTIPRWKVGSTRLNRIKAAHLYAKRLEDVAERFQEIVGSLPGRKQTYWMLKNPTETMRVTLVKFGGGVANGLRQWSTGSQTCTWPERNPAELHRDEGYWPNAVHNATEMLAWSTSGFQTDLAPWLWVGLAHFIERETFGEVRNFDFQEAGARDRWTVGGWPKKILSYVNRSKEPSFAEISAMELDVMEGIHNAMAWSFVDFLVTEHPAEFKKIFRAIKSHNDTARAIDQVMNLSTAGFHERWREYVQRNYIEKR